MSQRWKSGRGEGSRRTIVRLFLTVLLTLYIVCVIFGLHRVWCEILRAAEALASLSRLVAPAVLVVLLFRAGIEFITNPSVRTAMQLVFYLQVLILLLGRRRLPPDLLE